MNSAKIALLLHDIRSTHNVGSIFRTAECFGIKHIYCSGYTPYPFIPEDTRLPHIWNKLTKQIHKTALGAENMITCKYYPTIQSAILAAQDDGYTFLASLEQDSKSVLINDFSFNGNLLLILGNETKGIDKWTKDHSDAILEIPQYGKKESLNVANATAIALYQLTIKTKNEH